MLKTLALFPSGTCVDEQGQLWLGGCLASSLAQEYGTPLYIFDDATLRGRCRAYRQAMAQHYPGRSQVAYASKAYLNLALAQLFAQEGLSLDVVSGGELYVAQQAGFPAERIHFHGNNKSPAELTAALEGGVGRIVVDNFHELALLEGLLAQQGDRFPIWLRLSPGIDVDTHDYRKTGSLDSKFGFPLDTGAAKRALAQARNSPHLELVGLHAHIGSQILDAEPLALAATRLLEFAAAQDFEPRELIPGGGWGVPHNESDPAAPLDSYVQTVCQAVIDGCGRHGLARPTLVVEPGRSIVAPAGVALYRVGARKDIPGVRTYISVDGGISDNVRPALYGARYTALVADKANRPAEETVTIAGKLCESGDVLIRDIALPRLAAGDLLAIPAAGAYCLPMASNYNLAPRPAVVLVGGGRAKLIQRRESHQDLVARDVPLPTL
ncbi:MAG: diaminopimelate decarboxylase [Ardenticatenales bacterium]|nr:diaminopimelate decarboxylase [Ardenticatenales bacterium]